ncbi:MAG: PaaI family thioesterase [Chloroflexi bacterium]|nr:PaaI family thioesterase [Chloroflexota bacterium]
MYAHPYIHAVRRKKFVNSNIEKAVRASFAKQTFLKTIGAELIGVSAGEVEIELPFRSDLCQQHGFLHAGVVTSIVDTACGYAALSMMPEGSEVLSVEFKINLLSPAVGEKFLARGKVVKAGKTLTFVNGEVLAKNGSGEKLIATMSATMIARAG